MFNSNSRFNRFNKFNKNKNNKNKNNKNKNNTSTNITVEKIDTTETTRQESSNKSKTCESKQESKSKSNTHESKSKQESKKLTHTLDNDIINSIETLDEMPLVLSNVSENEKPSVIDTETLLYAKKPKNKSTKSTKYTLHFPKTVVVDNNKYTIINKYVKKNYNTIVDLLYNKKLLKNKNSPYRIVYHIYVNYLNEDLNIIIK